MKKPRFLYHVYWVQADEHSVATSGIFTHQKEANAFLKKSEELDPSDETEAIFMDQISTRKDVLLEMGDQFYATVLAHLGKKMTAVIYPFKMPGT